MFNYSKQSLSPARFDIQQQHQFGLERTVICSAATGIILVATSVFLFFESLGSFVTVTVMIGNVFGGAVLTVIAPV